jgi:hypothetical protein
VKTGGNAGFGGFSGGEVGTKRPEVGTLPTLKISNEINARQKIDAI